MEQERCIASANRSGVIAFSCDLPKGALPIAGARSEQELRDLIEPIARRGWDGATLLVPGVPEAPDSRTALDAFYAFCERVNRDALKRRAAP